MKKNILGILTLLTVILFSPKVFAANITSLEVSENTNGVIKVSGTAESSMIAAAIVVYDEEDNMVTMETTPIKDDDTFSLSITLDAAKYVVKVADYEGGEYVSKTVEPTEEPTEEATSETTPDTSDDVLLWFTIGLISIASLVGIITYRKRLN